jgi:hypothetical protein
MEVARVKEFSIYLTDRPGELAGVLEALAAAGASVTALSVVEQNGKGLVRLLGEPEGAVRRVCEGVTDTGAGPVTEVEVLAVGLGDNPGVFREVAVRLAAAGVNVRYAYQAPAQNGTPSRCILRVDDADRAESIIREVV